MNTGGSVIMEPKKNRNIIEQFRLFLEDNIGLPNPAVYGAYGVAITGLCVTIHRSKTFAKFTKPFDVPAKLVKKNVPLHGVIKHIEPSSETLLMVDHKPFVALPLLRKQQCLPVKLAGVDLTPNGISWLQAVACGKQVTCIPLSREKEFLTCIVSMHKEDNEDINIGEEITRLGFATVSSLPVEERRKRILAYQRSLYAAEKQARYKRNGLWHFASPPSLLDKLQIMLFNNILPYFIAK